MSKEQKARLEEMMERSIRRTKNAALTALILLGGFLTILVTTGS